MYREGWRGEKDRVKNDREEVREGIRIKEKGREGKG